MDRVPLANNLFWEEIQVFYGCSLPQHVSLRWHLRVWVVNVLRKPETLGPFGVLVLWLLWMLSNLLVSEWCILWPGLAKLIKSLEANPSSSCGLGVTIFCSRSCEIYRATSPYTCPVISWLPSLCLPRVCENFWIHSKSQWGYGPLMCRTSSKTPYQILYMEVCVLIL